MTITKEFILANHPEIAEALRADGRAAGLPDGAESERNRIRDVEAQSMPGHEKLIAGLKFDGKTSGAEAALQVLAAERTKLAGINSDLKSDAPAPAAAAPSATGDHAGEEATAEARMTPEERGKKRWDSDEKLRAEFGDDFKAYLAFEKANAQGRVKILGAKQAA